MKKTLYIEKIRKFNRYYANILGKIDQDIYNKPYPLTEARIIAELYYNSGCTSKEIIEVLGVDRGFLSRILQRFEEEQIITKKQSAEDKRQFNLYLTTIGEETFRKMEIDANSELTKIFQHLSEPEMAALVSSMERVESIYTKNEKEKPTVIIRPFQLGDVGYVAQLHGEFYGNHHGFFQIFEYYVMKGLTEFVYDSSGGELWIAEVNGERAGSIAIVQDDANAAQIRWFILDNHYQGLGIGTKLFETAFNFCKEQNYKHIYLWTISMLNAARHLYAKYGFTLKEEKENSVWCGERLIEERWDIELSDEK
ncbi:helix-turn-helix domain-containing GNAT family N-acetyltransferase [Psychrobacillus sp. NEAU-3TGS]|uniref:bifunctional helix-turn-helix transcriptional regulator/GNAT family N-acetyltransferase n=1 Tax=Psychrobacillus sp. NEAU-3TGS TaxID=2995412 RepID=UPI0024985109|nr:helix-turn-helix domain-containing GNAT family N-acetyltransferase [Psychrobacillus sp. NEAU-3TGS]MDI2588613.1 helix-turn-helix domain-containing GNAT family N-acetyltransferase [Psychrobacillus sp. NEAU-3TGS]